MRQKFGISVAILVFICSFNAKVVWSQFSFGNRGGFANSYSSSPLGTSLNFPSSKDWHHFGGSSISFANSDPFNDWPNTNFPRTSAGLNRNTGSISFAPTHTKNDFHSMFPNLDEQSFNIDGINKIRSGYGLPPLTTTTTTSRATKPTKHTTTTSSATEPTTQTTTTSVPQYERFHNYGNTFGRNWLLKSTYIARNNYYESEAPIGPGPLTKALFSSGALWGYDDNSNFNDKIRWNKNDDKEWRATTKAPYFENEVPVENKILPASAVIGAATAFGLVSLLSLRVPTSKPLMYCGNTNLKQLPIQIFDEIYICKNDKFEISCEENYRNQSNFNCPIQEMKCDIMDEDIKGNIYCKDGTLFSKLDIFCDRTISINETDEAITFLDCHEGSFPKHLASFIPTTTPRSTTTHAPKPLSISAKAHIFLLKLMGKFEVVEKKTPTTTETYPFPNFDAWHPEALTIPPETTTRVPGVKKIIKATNSISEASTGSVENS
ncbi:hypothetical protein ACKWTF_001165 [Chironomus riparius]